MSIRHLKDTLKWLELRMLHKVNQREDGDGRSGWTPFASLIQLLAQTTRKGQLST